MKKIGNITKALKLVIPIAPLGMAFYLLLSLPGAVLPVLMLHLQKNIVDRAVHYDSGQPLGYYMKPVLMMIGIYMIMKMFELISKQYMETPKHLAWARMMCIPLPLKQQVLRNLAIR